MTLICEKWEKMQITPFSSFRDHKPEEQDVKSTLMHKRLGGNGWIYTEVHSSHWKMHRIINHNLWVWCAITEFMYNNLHCTRYFILVYGHYDWFHIVVVWFIWLLSSCSLHSLNLSGCNALQWKMALKYLQFSQIGVLYILCWTSLHLCVSLLKLCIGMCSTII